MLDPQHFLAYVVRPSLDSIGLWSPAAERLLLGTAITRLVYYRHRAPPRLYFPGAKLR